MGLYGFFDASHADDVDTRKSTIAYTFFFLGCALSWKSKLHTFVTTSTNHSELVAAAMAAREAKFLWKFFGALGIHDVVFPRHIEAIDLFTDSMGVVALSRNPVLSAATKHVEIADFFVREMVERGVITVAHVPTTDMLADVFTKPLAKIKFSHFISTILGLARPSVTKEENSADEHSNKGASAQVVRNQWTGDQDEHFRKEASARVVRKQWTGDQDEHSREGASAHVVRYQQWTGGQVEHSGTGANAREKGGQETVDDTVRKSYWRTRLSTPNKEQISLNDRSTIIRLAPLCFFFLWSFQTYIHSTFSISH